MPLLRSEWEEERAMRHSPFRLGTTARVSSFCSLLLPLPPTGVKNLPALFWPGGSEQFLLLNWCERDDSGVPAPTNRACLSCVFPGGGRTRPPWCHPHGGTPFV